MVYPFPLEAIRKVVYNVDIIVVCYQPTFPILTH